MEELGLEKALKNEWNLKEEREGDIWSKKSACRGIKNTTLTDFRYSAREWEGSGSYGELGPNLESWKESLGWEEGVLW